MAKDISDNTEQSSRAQLILLGEGLAVGLASGLVVLAYRVALQYAGEWLPVILSYAESSPLRIAGWFGLLLLLAVVVGKLLMWEPMISGSGIPQLEGEIEGHLDPCWWKVVTAKFVGGFLCLLAGLSLGREGPSVQLGAMMGKGISRVGKREQHERCLLTCGASAGLAAAFHAPLAGVLFAVEEVQKQVTMPVILTAMTASLTADYLASSLLGFEPVFQFQVAGELPSGLYGYLPVLGLLLGLFGVVYNWATLKVQSAFLAQPHLNAVTRLFVPFLLAGVLGFTVPSLLGSGHNLVDGLTSGAFSLGAVLLLLVGKFLFSLICFGSGAPGGIFFPLLVLGALAGGAFSLAAVQYAGLDPAQSNYFIMLAMAGLFAAIVRAPLTGVVLIFEMTDTVSQLLPLAIVSGIAYLVANLLGSEPIYDSLLAGLLKRREKAAVQKKEKEEYKA